MVKTAPSRGEVSPGVSEPPTPDTDALEDLDDHDLVRLTQDGENEAFDELVNRYQRRAYWVSYNMIGDAEQARDIVQEGFIRAYKSIDRFKFKYRFYTWLYQIISNLSIDTLRKRGRRPKISMERVGPQSHEGRGPYLRLAADELKEQVREIIETLPPKYKIVMVLRDIESVDTKEIAEIIDRTRSTVRWRLYKARQIFRENWEERFGEMEPTAVEED